MVVYYWNVAGGCKIIIFNKITLFIIYTAKLISVKEEIKIYVINLISQELVRTERLKLVLSMRFGDSVCGTEYSNHSSWIA